MGLEKFDTSYWLTKDKIWVEGRKLQWQAIEKVVGLNRKKTEVGVIKRYFLNGILPAWEKYKSWDELFRPLDLRLFLWLHPSDSADVLKSLFIDYIQDENVHRKDITKGYGAFLDNELLRSTLPYKSIEQYPFVYMGDKNRILFNILFGGLALVRQRLSELFTEKEITEYVNPVFEGEGYLIFLRMHDWLLPKYNTPMIDNCLYQYPEVVDWCVTTLTEKSNAEFLESIEHQANVEDYQKALYCFYHYDVREEDDRARFQFLQKIRQVLDDGDFVPKFKEMWNGVKSGEIVCDGAF